jgi:hypothetical protein
MKTDEMKNRNPAAGKKDITYPRIFRLLPFRKTGITADKNNRQSNISIY